MTKKHFVMNSENRVDTEYVRRLENQLRELELKSKRESEALNTYRLAQQQRREQLEAEIEGLKNKLGSQLEEIDDLKSQIDKLTEVGRQVVSFCNAQLAAAAAKSSVLEEILRLSSMGVPVIEVEDGIFYVPTPFDCDVKEGEE